jgi:oligopeptidase A
MEELAELQARFEQNLLDSMAAWHHDYPHPTPPAGIPDTLVERARHAAVEAGVAGFRFHLDQPTYVAVITHAKDPELRAVFHRAWTTRASDENSPHEAFDNSALMDRILALRHEAANLVGFANFAEYSLATKMATSVAEVREFLQKLARAAKPAAVRDFQELEAFAGRPLAASDVAYYSEELLRQRFHVSDEELRPFFPLPRVLAGLFSLVRTLYGLQLMATAAEVWNPEVQFFRVLEPGGDVVGGLYADFYARPEKRSGAWMDDCLDRKNLGGTKQVPVAHLVCNFAPPSQSTPSLLSHDEVLTLFHELGHALHHLLTRVDYPSVAGIHGVPWDAVELPSQFMEGFAWEPEIVRTISGHHVSGEPLPAETLTRLRASRVFQGGMQMVRQLEFSLFDIRLHAEYTPGEARGVMDLLKEVRKDVAVVPSAPYDRFPHGFSHIFGGGYAAGYYSYKWAEVLSADAFAAFEEGGVLNAELATRFRERILEVGGTRDIGEAFRSFRGRAPDIAALLRHSGITPAPA